MDVPGLLSSAADRATGLAAGAGGQVLRRLRSVRLPGAGQASVTDDPQTAARRWRAVTVLKEPREVGTAQAPPPALAAFADRIEVRITPAPGDKGTELAARFRGPASDEDVGALRSAQVHGQRYMPRILGHMARGGLTTEHLATHVLPLDRAPEGYQMFKDKTDGCVRAVFEP